MARQKWNKEAVIEAIRARHKAGLSLNFSKAVADDEALTGAARRYFGSWYAAVDAAGYDAVQFKHKTHGEKRSWDRPTVLKEIKAYAESGGDLSAGSVRKYNSKLYSAAVSYFGSWRAALRGLGIDYEEVRLYQEWAPDKVIAAIRDAFQKGADLSDNTVSALRPDLYGAALTHFRSWRDALEEAGVDPEKARRTNAWDRDRLIEVARRGYEQGITFSQMTAARLLDKKAILRNFEGGIPELAKAIGVSDPEEAIESNLEKKMREMGMTAKLIAERINRTEMHVRHLMRAKYLPKLADALLIADVLDCDVRDIWTLKNTPPSQ